MLVTMWWSAWYPNGFLRKPWRNCTREVHDLVKSLRRSIPMLIWWVSHQILTLIALLMLRIWFHIDVRLIPLLINLWVSLPTTFFLRAPTSSTSSKITHATENIDSILYDQIIFSRNEGTGRYLVKWKKDLNQKIHGSLRRISDGLIPTYWSITTTSNNFPTHTRQGWVFFTPEETMRASRR